MNIQTDNIQANGTIQLPQPDIRSDFSHSPAILTVANDGTVMECNDIGEEILELPKAHCHRTPIAMLLPQLGKIDLLEESGERVNPYLRFLSRIGRNFEIITMNGRQFSGELYFNDINFHNQHRIIIMIYPQQ